MIFGQQISFIDEFEKYLFVELQTTVNDFDHVLENYITEQQLFERGIKGTGEKLPGYARTTIRLKIRKGQPVDRTTLRDEGDFHASIDVIGTPYHIEISSDVEHAKWLVGRYGRDILRITNENFKEFFNEYYIPNLKKYVDNKFTR